MTVSSNRWAVQQKNQYKFRRRFIRDFLLRNFAFRFFVKMVVHHPEYVPDSGSTILMINHRTAIDPILALGVIPNRDVVVMSKIENFQNFLTGIFVKSWGAYPIRRGEVDREALKTTLELLELGEIVLIAPEGTRQPQLTRPKEGLTYLALKANPVIVPTGIYNADHWGRNLFLPFRQELHVAFGKPFRVKRFEQKRVPKEMMQHISDEMMYQLAALLPEDYRGEYADLPKATPEYLEFVPT